MDARAPRRRSYENTDVRKLYETQLDKPNSAAAHHLLHTHYSGRDSTRSMLMRFLDCVDRRDAGAAASLFHSDGVWSTASPFGDIQGAANIESLIRTQLPPRKYGSRYLRHQMASAADNDDLTVITPDGHPCRFSLEFCTEQEDGRSKKLIKHLVRHVL